MRDFPARGAIAQLGERYNGIVEVIGSIPISSTIYLILDIENYIVEKTLADIKSKSEESKETE